MTVIDKDSIPKPPPLPAARVSDLDDHDGPIITGSANVFTEGLPQARFGDVVGPPCVKPIAFGSYTVFINGLKAARIGDPVVCTGKLAKPGAIRTFIGTGKPPKKANFFADCLIAAASIGAGIIISKVESKIIDAVL